MHDYIREKRIQNTAGRNASASLPFKMQTEVGVGGEVHHPEKTVCLLGAVKPKGHTSKR